VEEDRDPFVAFDAVARERKIPSLFGGRTVFDDIHLLPQAPKSYCRRLSLCSLPVPKQSEGSLGSVISSAQSANGGTWQSAHGSSCFLRRQCLCCPSLSFFCRHEISLLPIYGKQIGHHLAATARVARLRFPFCISFS
jgi:hypothetical protein